MTQSIDDISSQGVSSPTSTHNHHHTGSQNNSPTSSLSSPRERSQATHDHLHDHHPAGSQEHESSPASPVSLEGTEDPLHNLGSQEQESSQTNPHNHQEPVSQTCGDKEPVSQACDDATIACMIRYLLRQSDAPQIQPAASIPSQPTVPQCPTAAVPLPSQPTAIHSLPTASQPPHHSVAPIPDQSAQSAQCPPPPPDQSIVRRLLKWASQLDFTLDCSDLVMNWRLHLQLDGTEKNPSQSQSWLFNYTVMTFLMNGYLYAEYMHLQGMLGLPTCSDSGWQRIVAKLEKPVTELAEITCENVRIEIRERGDHKQWVASYDGFYLTRGHHSNNSSATLHDYETGKIAWFEHRTKRGPDHNWEGTSNGAESDMLNSILQKVSSAGFVLSEIITDKDSSMNSIYTRHFPEGIITFCSNHSAKTLHKDLQKIRSLKCGVNNVINT